MKTPHPEILIEEIFCGTEGPTSRIFLGGAAIGPLHLHTSFGFMG